MMESDFSEILSFRRYHDDCQVLWSFCLTNPHKCYEFIIKKRKILESYLSSLTLKFNPNLGGVFRVSSCGGEGVKLPNLFKTY